jgi:glutathione peroxidase-family protein
LIGAWFHQDFDIEGETAADVIAAFKNAEPAARQQEVRRDIERFLEDNAEDLEARFEATFQPDIIASVLSESTRVFLEEIAALLPG